MSADDILLGVVFPVPCYVISGKNVSLMACFFVTWDVKRELVSRVFLVSFLI